MNRLITRTTLAGSGAILGLIGGALMLAPKAFLEMSHVFVERDAGLMSELTAPSGVLLLTGALMVIAAVKIRFADLALSVGAIVYGSYGLGRLISIAMHGVPPQSLIVAMMIELGVAGLLVALQMKEASKQQWNLIDTLSGELIV